MVFNKFWQSVGFFNRKSAILSQSKSSLGESNNQNHMQSQTNRHHLHYGEPCNHSLVSFTVIAVDRNEIPPSSFMYYTHSVSERNAFFPFFLLLTPDVLISRWSDGTTPGIVVHFVSKYFCRRVKNRC